MIIQPVTILTYIPVLKMSLSTTHDLVLNTNYLFTTHFNQYVQSMMQA